jgi:hypothetical protein
MDRGDKCFGVVHGEGIHLRTVRFAKTRAPKVQGWILVDRSVSVSKHEGSLQDADGVVVGLFTPAMAVCNGNETRVSDVEENHVAEVRAPNAIKDLSIRPDRCGRHVVPTKSRLAVRKVCIEDVTAQSSTRHAAQTANKPVVRELLFEGECAQADLMFDCL